MLLWSFRVDAFPETLKYGYSSCLSCHISPSGGGALTQYGRSLSEQILSSFSYAGEGQLGHYDFGLPTWLALGGDGRYVNIARETNEEPEYKFIQMQRDFEIGAITNYVFGAARYGIYQDTTSESRTHYAGLSGIIRGVYLRYGKFAPAYGTNTPDHTAFGRSAIGLGQGKESYNAEASYIGKLGEVFLTAITHTKTTDDFGKTVYTSDDSGYAARLTWFAAKGVRLGSSFMRLDSSTKYGGFCELGYNKWLYLGLDVNELVTEAERALYSYGKLHAELLKGFNFLYESNYSQKDGSYRENNWGFDWYPRPHFQFLGKVLNQQGKGGYMLLSHYWF